MRGHRARKLDLRELRISRVQRALRLAGEPVRVGSRTSLAFALALFVIVTTSAAPAFAYRPFDGTDGDVAAEGEFELELGPAQYISQPDGHYIIAPATVLNLGLVQGFELVVDFKTFISLDSDPAQSRVRLLDTDVFIKAIVRRGVLQGDTGPSMAIEAGPLLPEAGGASDFGAQANLITSYNWTSLTLHLNTSAAISREHNFEGFVSLIGEGPRDWVVRPVGEVFVEREWNVATTYSGLVGAIWQVSDKLAIDAGVRAASHTDGSIFEVRFGLTWTLPVWAAKGEEEHGK
jgi:hypothetical protein